MRITFLTPNAGLSGGIRVLGTYATALARMGHAVVVVEARRRPPSFRERARALLHGSGWRQPSRSASHLDGLPIERREVGPDGPRGDVDVPDADVVIATWWETAEWMQRLGGRKGAKVYFVQHHETAFPGQPAERVEATYRMPFRKIAIAPWLVDLMRVRYGDPDVTLVPNGVDLQTFNASPRDKQQTPTVGFMFSSLRFKGCDITLRALELARVQIPELSVRAFGSEPPTDVPTWIPVAFSPPQAEIRDIYAACDAWLFASRSEGFGLPLLEAMACRTPVIATPAGAGPELVGAGGGILVRHEDPEDMSRAIVLICRTSGEDWRALSERACAIASGYSWESSARLFERALTRAASFG